MGKLGCIGSTPTPHELHYWAIAAPCVIQTDFKGVYWVSEETDSELTQRVKQLRRSIADARKSQRTAASDVSQRMTDMRNEEGYTHTSRRRTPRSRGCWRQDGEAGAADDS